MALEPTNKNFLGQTGFRLVLDRIPNVTYFSQSASLPGISLSVRDSETPLLRYPLPGNTLEFAPFNITFRVDEDMTNYLEIYNWMIGLGFPTSTDQRRLFIQTSNNRAEESDATLIIMSSKYNPNIRVKFQRMFPESISDLRFDTMATDIEYLEATVTFRYTQYTIESI